MKQPIGVLLVLLLLGGVSCETIDLTNQKGTYLEYLEDKTIVSIDIDSTNSLMYIYTSRYCDTCYVAPHMSYIPTIEEWTVINDSSYVNFSNAEFSGIPKSDQHGNIYKAKGNAIYKMNDNNVFVEIINTGDYMFYTYAFDNQDNIWFCSSENGIAYWDKSSLEIFTSSNSDLPCDRIHGLAVDKLNRVWVSLDFDGLLKIESGNWTVISNSDIPGLSDYSYLRGPLIDTEDNVWFEVFNPDTTSNILRISNNNWIYESPDNTKYSDLKLDSKNIVWAISRHYENEIFTFATLKYYSDNTWNDFNAKEIDSYITCVNSDDYKVYIGTLNGLVEKPK